MQCTLIHCEYTDKFVALFNQFEYVRILFDTKMGGAPKCMYQCIMHLYKIFDNHTLNWTVF